MPANVVENEAVVWPLLHTYVAPAVVVLATTVTVVRVHVKGPVLLAITEGVAVLLTTVVLLVAVQTLTLLTVTLYGPEAETMIDAVVAPVLQRYVGEIALVAVAVRVPLGWAQVSVRLLTLTEGVSVLLVTVVDVVAVQPLADVSVTEYTPGSVVVKLAVVWPELHR